MGRCCLEFAYFEGFRCIIAEFIGTFIFVFAGQGSVLAFESLTNSGSMTPAGLTSVALSHAFALFAGVLVAVNISGAHLNPAVTFSLFLGGHIGFIKGILYWIAQIIGSIVACLLLSFIVTDITISPPALSDSESVYAGLMLEITLTFLLVYTIFATAIDERAKGNVGLFAPLAIALVVGANILVGGAFDGSSMNPARALGPALVAWDFTNQWLYWVGPLVGGTIATIIYETLLIPHPPFPTSINA